MAGIKRETYLVRSRPYNLQLKPGLNSINLGRAGLPIISGLIAHFDETSIIGDDIVSEWQNKARSGPAFNLDTVVGTAANLTRMADGVARLPGAVGDSISTPDSALNSVLGDIDMRWFGSLDDWTPAVINTLISKFGTGIDQAYKLEIDTLGNVRLSLSVDGTAVVTAISSALPVVVNGATLGIRATWTVAGQEAVFYTSANGVIWTQLGIPVALVAASIHDSAQPIEIGGQALATTLPGIGYCRSAQVWDGIPADVSSKDVPIGPELLDTPLTYASWTELDGAGGQNGAAIDLARNGGASNQLMKTTVVPMVTGKFYRVAMDFSAISNSVGIFIGPTANIGLTLTSSGFADFEYTLPGGLERVDIGAGGNSLATATITAFSFREIVPGLVVNFDASQAVDPQAPWVDPDTGATWTPQGDAFVNTTGRDVVNSAGLVGIETAIGQLLAQPNTVFAAARFTSVAEVTQEMILSSAKANALQRNALFASGAIGHPYLAFAGLASVGFSYTNEVSIWSTLFNGIASSFGIDRPSGSVTELGDWGAEPWDFATLFNRQDDISPMTGWIGEYAVYNRVLTPTEIAQVQEYLGNKWL